MFDFLSQKFSSIFSSLQNKKALQEGDVDAALEQVKHALLEADVPYDLVEEFANQIKQEVVGQKVVASLKPAEQLLTVVNDKLISFLGGQTVTASFQIPSVVMVMGLQGSGKTTSIAKMVHFVVKEAEKRGKKRRVLCASVDFYRPAAIDQLAMLAAREGVSFYRARVTDPVNAAREIYAHFKQEQYDLLFLDTAGRLHVDNQMLQELRTIESFVAPKHKLLVLDAMTGQESLAVARAFDQAVGFQAAILSKMDSDTRGGAAFSFRYALKKPIIFIGTGEKGDDFEQFHPERAASRMLGMGDIKTLVERANEKIKESEQEQVNRAILSGKMTLDDFAKQMDMVNRLGSISSLMKYMPGMSGMKISQDQLEQGQKELGKFRVIMSSMTRKERLSPHILDASRKKRVAQGAGVEVVDVDMLLSRFQQAQQYAKLLKKLGPFKSMFK
jgi:signal recognition particle subunit SRP54